MATNKTSRDTMVVVAVVVAFIVTVMANLLADKKFARVDLTAEGRYSLSEPFQHILDRLEDPLKVTYYVSQHAPPIFDPYRRDMLDKLHDVELAAHGKITLEVIDPQEKKELRDRLEKDGFEIAISGHQKDQEVQAIVFTGLELLYQDKPKAQIPKMTADGLEYALGSKIIELTTKKKPVIAFCVPPAPPQNPQAAMMGQRQQGSGYEFFSQGMWDEEKKFEIKSVEITENSPIPADAKLLVLIRPKVLTERQKYEVTRYVAGGGKLLLVAAPFKLFNEFGWRVEKSPTGLEDYLKDLGVSFNPNFLADNSNVRMVSMRSFFQGQPAKEEKLPFFVRIIPENIDQESVLTKRLPGMVAPFPAAIEIDDEKVKKNGLKESVLAKTSKQTWMVPFSENFDPKTEMSRDYDEERQHYDGQKNVFVLLEGQFPFPYEGKAAPEWGGPPTEPKEDKKDAKKDEPTALEKKPGIVAVISSPDAFHQQLLESRDLGQLMQGNLYVIPNMAEDFSLGDDLIRLRIKHYETRAIKGLGGAQDDIKRNLLKIGLIVGMPILLLIVGLLRFFLRRASQTGYERKFAQTIGPSSFTP